MKISKNHPKLNPEELITNDEDFIKFIDSDSNYYDILCYIEEGINWQYALGEKMLITKQTIGNKLNKLKDLGILEEYKEKQERISPLDKSKKSKIKDKRIYYKFSEEYKPQIYGIINHRKAPLIHIALLYQKMGKKQFLEAITYIKEKKNFYYEKTFELKIKPEYLKNLLNLLCEINILKEQYGNYILAPDGIKKIDALKLDTDDFLADSPLMNKI